MKARTRQTLKRLSTLFAIVATLMGGTLLIARRVVEASTRGRMFTDPSAVPCRTVAIVPGARVWSDGTPSPPLVDRLESARTLYAMGRVQRILVSGDHGRQEYDEANAMRRYLVARGVRSADVVLDHAGFRTLDTMDRASSVFGVTDAVVVTQRFHLARAVYLARHAGIDAVGMEAAPVAYGERTVDSLREPLASARAVLDVALLGSRARLLGPPVPVMGDATRSHDARTRSDLAFEGR